MATKTPERLVMPSKRRQLAQRAMKEATAAAGDAQNRVDALRGANDRHQRELDRNRYAQRLETQTEALRRGGGLGGATIYFNKKGSEDPFERPHTDAEIAEAVKKADAAQVVAEKARGRWQKVQTETVDVLQACKKAGTRYYRLTDPPDSWRGAPVPTSEIIDLPEWKLRALVQGRVYGELPSEVLT